MPSISKETLRAWLYLNLDGNDYPAEELSYRSEVQPADSFTLAEHVRFKFFRTRGGVEELLTYVNYVIGTHSVSHIEREFIDTIPVQVARGYEEAVAAHKEAELKFQHLQEILRAANFPT